MTTRSQLRTFSKNGKDYVLATNGQEYIIKISSPFDKYNRSMCVTTVDGLDVLTGKKGKEVGFALVDEISSVTSKSNDTDERQHNVCSYLFVKENGDWKDPES